MLNWIANKLVARHLKNEPDYMENDFWIHNNGILKGSVLHALWERVGDKIRISYYGSSPKEAPARDFDTLGEAVTFLEKL